MANPWDIRNAAKRVRASAEDVRQEAMAIRNEIDGTLRYWAGDASKALRSELTRIVGSMRSQQQGLDRLEGSLNRLAGEVYRADEEREQRRLAAERAARERAERERLERESALRRRY